MCVFVDVVAEAFQTLCSTSQEGVPTKEVLYHFVNRYFSGPGDELELFQPKDWTSRYVTMVTVLRSRDIVYVTVRGNDVTFVVSVRKHIYRRCRLVRGAWFLGYSTTEPLLFMLILHSCHSHVT